MGRSVSYPGNAQVRVYVDVSNFDDGGMDWDWFIENIKESLSSKFPSLKDTEQWLGREDKAILHNNLVYVGVSEYCGLACIWVLPKESEVYYSDDKYLGGFADTFCCMIEPFIESTFGTHKKVATFSNGESVYQAIEKAG